MKTFSESILCIPGKEIGSEWEPRHAKTTRYTQQISFITVPLILFNYFAYLLQLLLILIKRHRLAVNFDWGSSSLLHTVMNRIICGSNRPKELDQKIKITHMTGFFLWSERQGARVRWICWEHDQDDRKCHCWLAIMHSKDADCHQLPQMIARKG